MRFELGLVTVTSCLLLGALCVPAAQCSTAPDTTDTFELAEFWPPAAGRLYAIPANSYDGNQVLDRWHPDGYEGGASRVGTGEGGVTFTVALAFPVADLDPNQRVAYARLRLSSAGAEMVRGITLEIRGLIGAAAGFSDESLPSQFPKTETVVVWRIPRPWSEGRGRLPLYYTSPDVSPIVNEMLAQPGFRSGEGTLAFSIGRAGDGQARRGYIRIHDFARASRSHNPALLEICRDRSDTFLTEPMLGRPTDHSITLNVLGLTGIEAYAEFASASGPSWAGATSPVRAQPGTPLEIVIDGLEPDTEYQYQVVYIFHGPGEIDSLPGPSGAFHTRRPPGADYAFTIQADSHIIGRIKQRNRSHLDLYELTLENVLRDHPDFHFSMGDFAHIEFYTSGSASNLQDAMERYLVQRRFLGDLGRQVPFFLVLGNHEAEQGWRRTRESDSLEVWGSWARKATIPNPYPDDFYSGSSDTAACCGLRENYYAWHWGDALFVVLDPFWYTIKMPHRAGPYISTMDPWDWTLGIEQYNWLYRTLSESDARWKFVFAHHITGGLTRAHGKEHPYGRGGIDAVKYKVSNKPSFEWGGEDENGVNVFESKRPGWKHGPIHDILLETGVDIFFHGHDHAFVYEELDGVVYQECPVPSSAGYETGYVDRELYTTGRVVNNSGHLRVTVSPDSVLVEYVRAVLPQDEPLDEDGRPVRNGTVSYSYSIRR